MKPFDYYSKPQVAYPNKLDYITFYVYDKGEVLWSGPTYEKSKSDLKKEYPNAIIQEVLNEKSYLEHKKQYGEEKHRLCEEFMNDIFVEFGVSDNPKRHKAFVYACEKGDPNGLEEVYNIFSDIVELIKED